MNINKQARNSFPPNPSPNEQINDQNGLFSFDEIMSLVNELVINISSCSTRMEQFQVIANLTLKYIDGQSR